MKIKVFAVIMLLISIILLSGCTTQEPPSGQMMVKNIDTGKEYINLTSAINDKNTSNGDTLFIYSGNWGISYTSINITKSLTIIGESTNITIISGTDEFLQPIFISDNISNISISNITMDTCDGINLISGDNIIISDCRFYDSGFVRCNSSDNIIIKNCIFNGGSIWMDYINNISIYNCNISNTVPIIINNSNYVNIYDSFISETMYNGIQFSNVNNGSIRNTSISNVEKIQEVGILLKGCVDINLDNNTISGFYTDVSNIGG